MNTIFKSKNIFDQMCTSFVQETKQENVNIKDVKTKLKELQLVSIVENKTDTFCKETEMLANQLTEKGKLNIGNIIYGEIIKLLLQCGQLDKAESVIKKSIEICNNQNDKMHLLARLTDLEYIYKQQHRRKDLYYILGLKRQCAKEIIKKHEENSKNFSTISHKPTTINAVKIQLARIYTDLARMLQYKKPKDSIGSLKKAKEIYEEINCNNEVKYLDAKIKALSVDS